MDQDPKELEPADGYDAIIKLRVPVKFGNDSRSVINIAKPKVKNMRRLPIDLSEASFDVILDIAYECSDFDVAQMFDEIDGSDVMSLVEVMMNFLGLGQVSEKTVDLS